MTEKEIFLNQLKENNTEATFLVDKKGIVDSCNEIAAHLFGYDSIKEAQGVPVRNMVPEDFSVLFPKEISQEHLTQGAYLKRVNKKKDGTLFPTFVLTKYITLDNIQYVVTKIRKDNRNYLDREKLQHRRLYQNIEVIKCEFQKNKNKKEYAHSKQKKNPKRTIHISPRFREILNRRIDNLSVDDICMAWLIYLGLKEQEITRILSISQESTIELIHHLKIKLQLTPGKTIQNFLIHLINE